MPETLMRREIREVPRLLAAARADDGATIAPLAGRIAARPPRAVVLVARGSSDHAAVYARYLLELAIEVPVSLAAPSLVTLYGQRPSWPDALFIAISQSGASPDLRAVLEAARAGGATTCAIVNDTASALATAAEHVIPIGAGPERSVAATKSYILALDAVARLAAAAGRTSWARELERIPEVAEEVLAESERWLAGDGGQLVEVLAAADRAFAVARGINLATALETALKLRETGQLFADGYSAADIMHGPVTSGGPDVPALVFEPDGPAVASLEQACAALERVGSPVWRVGTRGLERGPSRLPLPVSLPELLTPIVFALPGYLVAEATARRRGRDPDAPAGLSKVTQTR